MKHFSKLLLCLPLFFLFIQSNCKKDGLTKETQIGANTFSCRVDGVIFKPVSLGGLFSGYPSVLSVGNSRNYNQFGVSAYNQQTTQRIGIEYTYLSNTGVYKLRQYPFRGIYSGGYSDPGWFPTDSIYTGQLILTRCDTINKIYSGTFSFTAKEPNTGRVVQITDGRFDVKE
jgi:hypothetical protein